MRTTRHGLRVLVALLGLMVLLTACGSATTAPTSAGTNATAGFPITIKAVNGKVTITSRPKAIVSLSPTATEMLYAIGAGHQVKAVDNYSDYPSGAPVTKLNGTNPNVEAIANYKPDLVVVSSDTSGFNKQMANLHIPVIYDPAASSLNQAYQEYLGLGEATGNASGARAQVASVKARIARIVSTTPKAPTGATYYYELDPTYYSVTSSTFVGQVLGLLGLRSIADSAQGAAASGGYPQLNAEFILNANPTYIFLADTICCGASAQSVAARPGFSDLSAIKNGRIGSLNDDIASRWGPRITILLQDVANALNAHTAPTTS
jgi:iron complex transport system substrate-binding protein